MSNEFLDYVEDIIDAMEKAETAIVGEATKRLPKSLRNQYPHIPWKQMAGMRDRIIHGYDNVDLEIVWDVVTQDIPQVKPHLQQILADYGASWPPEPEDNE
jgi:uncharacterized protein with HEPN domain